MIFKEVAIEPAYLSNWDRVRLIIDQCGFDHGRLISEFPRNWQWKVFENCAGCAPVEKKRIEEYLRGATPKLVRRGRVYCDHKDWIWNAREEHRRLRFFAVVTNDPCPGQRGFIHGPDVHAGHAEWAVPLDLVIGRQTRLMAECAVELLKEAREVIFVDPHFEAKAAFTKPLCELLRLALEGKSVTRIEYHLESAATREHFEGKLHGLLQFLPPGIPCPLRFLRWRSFDQPPRDAMHPRYILTDVGGLQYDYGLCEGNDGETTDVRIVAKAGAVYCRRWPEFAAGSTSFQFVDGFEITCSGNISEICIRDGRFETRSND